MSRKARQVCDGGFLRFGISRATVRSEMLIPSLSNSPWTHGLPQSGFAFAIFRINSLISRPVPGRPMLDWKPASGINWMTTGQLLKHLTESCGAPFRAFIKGEWGLPEGVDFKDLPAESMLPPAEKLPSVASVSEATQLLLEDKQLAFEMLRSCSEEELATRPSPAPWDSAEIVLGHRLLQMIDHLKQHKGQLFYYLKLQGKSVNTGNLWGA